MTTVLLLGTAVASLQSSQPRPFFTCQPWGSVREYMTSSVDCRFAVDDKGVPEFIEGLAWKACGERKVVRWDTSVSPPVPQCARQEKRRKDQQRKLRED